MKRGTRVSGRVGEWVGGWAAYLQCQKRPTTVSKETYYSVKRDLLQRQKRPTTVCGGW